MSGIRRRFLVVVALLACGVAGFGHPAYLTAAHAVIKADGSCRVTIQFDTLAFMLNDTSARIGNEPMEALLKAPRADVERALADARSRFERGFAIVTDHGTAAPMTIQFPAYADIIHWRDTAQPVLPVVIPLEVEVRLPAGAHTVAFRFPTLLAEVILTVERPGEDFFTEPVESGDSSTALALRISR